MTQTRIRIAMVEDDHLCLNLWCDYLHLREYKDYIFEIVGKSTFGKDALVQAQKYTPDIVVVDLMLPDIHGYELGLKLNALPNPPKVLFLSGHTNQLDYEQMVEAGFLGYLVKPIKLPDLLEPLAQIYEGETYMDAEISSAMLKKSLQKKANRPVELPQAEPIDGLLNWAELLTPSERTVFHHFEQGLTQKLIAQEMGLKPATVKTHLKHIREKSSFLTLDEFRVCLAERKKKR